MMHEPQEREALNERFKGAHPRDIMAYACEFFGDDIAISSSFGADSACLLSLAVAVKPSIPVIFINTGFHFPETLAFRDELVARLKLNLKEVGPAMGHAEFLKQYGKLYESDPDRCCEINKVEPLKRAMVGLRCWMSGVRADQTAYRQKMQFFEQKGEDFYKVSPLLGWSTKQVFDHIKASGLPMHPLWDKGYSSIGCEPCTAVPGDPGDPRSGRWKGKNKSECGIHTFLDKPAQAGEPAQ
ncbi:MAG TPA: phosphoadenylyl-sulfate reductase [bacterium]|nr:phosphoadenylyl-sulfate reductase [bacterium]